MYAIESGDEAVVFQLLDAGVDINAEDKVDGINNDCMERLIITNHHT